MICHSYLKAYEKKTPTSEDKRAIDPRRACLEFGDADLA